jgi:uncharacterized protein YacL
MSDAAFAELNILVGAVLPLLIAYLNSSRMTTDQKRFIAAAVSFAAAVVMVALREGLDFRNINAAIHSAFLVFGASQAFYFALWSKIAPGAMQTIENFPTPLEKILPRGE